MIVKNQHQSSCMLSIDIQVLKSFKLFNIAKYYKISCETVANTVLICEHLWNHKLGL